jgi:cysteine desulfurase
MRIGTALYLDHQATTPIDSRVLAEMVPFFEDSFGNPHSSDHVFGWRAAQVVENAAARVARLIGADGDEIVFTSGATEANNFALLGLARRASGQRRHRILLGATEHKSVLAVGRVLEQQLGFIVEQIPVDSEGRIQSRLLKEAVGEDVLLVSIMAVNNEIGTIQDIGEIAEITRSVGALLHCDAAQAPCAMDLASIADMVDLLSLSAHKMYGPQGVGGLYARRELHDRLEPVIYGGGQQNGLRSGTVPVPLCVGMGAAAALLERDEAAAEREQIGRRRDRFVEELTSLPWPVRLNGPKLGQDRHPCNANIRFEGFSAHDILGALQPRLAASTGSACSTGMPEPSHVLRAIGLTDWEADSSVRFSFGRGTTDADVTEAVSMIRAVLTNLARADLTQTA